MVKRKFKSIHRSITPDSRHFSSPTVCDDQFLLAMVFVKNIPRNLCGSAAATSTAPVPGVSTQFVAVMCSPVPGDSFAVASADFHDPANSHLFHHRDNHFVLRHSTQSTAMTRFPPISPPVIVTQTSGASRAVVYAGFPDSVHTLLFRHRVNHSVDLLQFGDSVIDFSSSFPGFVELVAPPGRLLIVIEMIGEYSLLNLWFELLLIYGSLTRPPECCSTSCLWRTSTTMVCLWPHIASATIFVADVADVLRYLESRHSYRQGELWFESYKRYPSFGIVRLWLALWTGDHVFSFTKSGLMMSSSASTNDSLVMASHLCHFPSSCLFFMPLARSSVALLTQLNDASHINALLCVALVYQRIRDGLLELLLLIQQMDISFERWFFLLACHSSYMSTHGEFWLLVFQEAYVIYVTKECCYFSHQFCSHDYKQSFFTNSRVIQNLQNIWTNTRLLDWYESLQQSSWLCFPAASPFVDSHIHLPNQSRAYWFLAHRFELLSTRFGTLTTFPFGSLPRPPEALQHRFFMSKMKLPFIPFHLEGEY